MLLLKRHLSLRPIRIGKLKQTLKQYKKQLITRVELHP